MVKRKNADPDDSDENLSVPLPIQSFLWRQTSPFIRPKQHKLCEASCVSFERVVVQNILHGLSPSLCEAVQSISRWKLIQAAFPHVMQSCAALLNNRRRSHPEAKFGPSESKLLYSLHWILLDAASECEDADPERFAVKPDQPIHMHNLSSIQLFVYLFAPLVHTLRPPEFQTLKLENGLRLWQPMWDFRQPDIPCFATPVKPQRSVLTAQRNLLKVNTNAANIYVGKGSSRENLTVLPDSMSRASINEPTSPLAPLARMSDICTLSLSESQTATLEIVCEKCNTVMSMKQAESSNPCACGGKEGFIAMVPDSKTHMFPSLSGGGVDRDYIKEKLASAVNSGNRSNPSPDLLSASYFDVAVLRCLFCLNWAEDGVYWALRYMHQRMLEVCDANYRYEVCERSRSQSLPIPDLSLLQGLGKPVVPESKPPRPPSPRRESGKDKRGSASQPHSPTERSHPHSHSRPKSLSRMDTFSSPEIRREPPYKKIKVYELKQFFEVGRALMKKKDGRDAEGSGSLSPKQVHHEVSAFAQVLHDDAGSTSMDTDPELIHPMSSMGPYSGTREKEERLTSLLAGLAGRQRKSMPSLPQSDSSSHHSTESSNSSQADIHQQPEPLKKPIITITEHCPEPKIFSMSNYELSSPQNGQADDESTPGIPRSMTDSNIDYMHNDDITEASGSSHYIQENGHLNYKVVLQAVQFVSMNSPTPRICEVLLNVLNCLQDLDIIETPKSLHPPTPPSSPDTPDGPPHPKHSTMAADDDRSEIPAHSLAMDSLFRIFRSLGCPQGCGDGMVGPQGDSLRLKGQACLQRLHKTCPQLFCKFLRDTIKHRPLQDTVDFLHAFLGFCVDPALLTQSPVSPVNKKSASQETLPRNGYSNNFGHSIGGEGYRGVEGVLIANLVKPFISRCVECVGELYGHENIGLFCDVRQLMAYIKEIHGGTFRRVALSGLLDSLLKLKRQQVEKEKERLSKPVSPVRRTTSVTSESGDEREGHRGSVVGNGDEAPTTKQSGEKSRRSIFRRNVKKKSLMFHYPASDSELVEESMHGKLSPRTSISAAEDDPPSGTTTPKRRFSKLQIGWRRGTKSDHEEDIGSEASPLDRRESKSDVQVHRVRGKMSFKAASHATLTFLSARKRIEDGLKTFGKRMSKRGSSDDFRRPRSSLGREEGSEVFLVREKRMVDRYLIKSGMLRFSFLLECCPPGTFPDPQLVAAMLDLEAPVSARASMLLECAHFIHRCNRGDWPNWMKLNLPSFRHTVAALQNRGQPSGYRRNLILQRAAGRLFYSWAENLGSQLEYILAKEHADRLAILNEVKDENKRKELRMEDEEEDFLDENTVNASGTECPYALKMLGCLVLMEITTFLRETMQYLPKSRGQKRDHIWEKSGTTARRFSSIVSSPGHSDKSMESMVADLPQSSMPVGSPSDRKISFAVLTERSDSFHSSTTSIPTLDPQPSEEKKERGRRLAQGRTNLLRQIRRGSGPNTSFRYNRSFKLKRPEAGAGAGAGAGGGAAGGGGSIKQKGSVRSRKVSSQSLQSEGRLVEEESGLGVGEDTESVAMLSDDTQESPNERDLEVEDEHLCENLPWIKVVVQLANLSNFICAHQSYCHPNCYERQRRSCSRLILALRKIYESTEEDCRQDNKTDVKKDTFREKLKRRESVFQLTSPTRRRESTPLLEKIKTDVSMTKLKLNNWKKDDKPKLVKEDPPIIKYLTSQAQRLTQCPMAILTKAAPILSVENFIDIMPVAWELILESDQELAAAAATVFLLSSVKSADKARNMITKELQHEETTQRINAVLRFGTLWRFRHQVWPRMEEGANNFFKVPPPGIDFTLPSPTIGLPNLSVVDPPWMPHFKTKIEEVTVNQEETKSLVTATTTRRKQQQEMIRRALHAEEERKRVGREKFPMTTVPVSHLAAFEPALKHAGEEHEEGLEEGRSCRQQVDMYKTGEEDRTEHTHHLQVAQSFFPSCVCAAVLPVLHLLDDTDVNSDGIAVSEVAHKVIWSCIVEDPILFLRHFLEKLTNKDKQEELMFVLRKLVIYFRQLPAQTAHSLFNYLIGYVMFYVRSPCEGGQEAIAGALSLLWMITPCVEGIYFKDLKQTLKKEQCDPYLLISATVASAKKILVHGPDLSSIPSQLPIHEDTQFNQILQESLEFFNIPEDQYPSHFLVDTKTHQIQNLNAYVRDFYFFRRNFYPQLSLVQMNAEDAFLALQKRVFTLKFVEVGKVLFTAAVLGSTPGHQLQNHVSFLHEEFLKLPAFPRKALEAEFDMYHGQWGKELYNMDTLHKYSWAKLMMTMFSSMPSTFAWSSDLPLFLNVLNGTLILLFEDTAILRYCLASLINTCRHFKHIFATNGFLYIMPTILRIYSNNQCNPVVRSSLEFVCRQFYLLHRKPFILQMFGSIAPILDMSCAASGQIDCSKVQPNSLFKLMLALEHDCPDKLHLLDLVQGEKPLRALDFCYASEDGTFDMMDVINMCVTVIAYAPDSFRSVQMLTILEVLVPRYLSHARRETSQRDNPSSARAEINVISSIAISLRALLGCCEYFTRNMSVPQRQLEAVNSNAKPMQNHSTHSLNDDREESHFSRYMEEGGRRKTYATEPEDLECRTEFRRPRDSILSIVADFYITCQARLKELRKILADPGFRPPELLDYKAHNRLAEIAHTLLKLAPYDPLTMGCMGLQRYMAEILPVTDWSQEMVRPALNLILRRLDRLFTKLYKKTGLQRQVDWEAAANILKGVYLTLRKYYYISYLPHMKTLISVLISILLSSSGGGPLVPDTLASFYGSHRSDPTSTCIDIPPIFISAAVKVVAVQMQALGDQYSLELTCGGPGAFQSKDRTLNLLVNFIYPLCIRVGCGRRDMPKLSGADTIYVLSITMGLLGPGMGAQILQHNAKLPTPPGQESARAGSISQIDKTVLRVGSELQQQVAFLGLQILMVCFDKQLAEEWHHVSKCIQLLATKGKIGLPFWKFLDFLCTHRPTLFLLLQTFIDFRMMRVNCDTAQEYYLQQTIKDKLQGFSFTHPKCSSAVLVQQALDLRQLREELYSAITGGYRSRSATFQTDHSDFQADLRSRSSLVEVTADILGPSRIPPTQNKRSSYGAVFSRSSSVTSAPVRSAKLSNTDDPNMSPLVRRCKSTRRISACEGSRILEKFAAKNPAEDSSLDGPYPESPARLQRQLTICRGHLSKQNSQEEPPAQLVFENEEAETANGGVSMTGEELGLSPDGDDPHVHRLQRQDAKSRKTFKIKRQKTKSSNTGMRRFMSHRGRFDLGTGEGASAETSPRRRGMAVVFQERGASFHLGRPGGGAPMARSVETIPESMELKPSRIRFVPRSKSHDDPAPCGLESSIGVAPASSGSAVALPGRIMRQGARIVRSGSPSPSPDSSRKPLLSNATESSPDCSPMTGPCVLRSESSDSLSANESSALLKEEEKSNSVSSLTLYYADEDVPDTVV